jgi:hypothetical protein
VFSEKEQSNPKAYEYKSCILSSNLGFGTGNPPFERCTSILQMQFEKGLYDE